MSAKPQILKGFRDYPPELMTIRNKVLTILTSTFERFGYVNLQTPSLEYQEVLTGKSGAEAEKLIYKFADQGGRQIGLIYDLTVPTARFMAMNPNIIKPFKRYQIQRVWRADKPQKGRYREITQCDFDIFGVSSPLADAEILTIVFQVLNQLDLTNITIKINDRNIIKELLSHSGVTEADFSKVMQTLDKLDKTSTTAVQAELNHKGLTTDTINKIFTLLQQTQPNDNINMIINYLEQFGVDKKAVVFTPTLARGLDYYTGAIFEVVVEWPKMGSIAGGGRYDSLIEQYTGTATPATGISFGLDRLCDVLEERHLAHTQQAKTQVLVTVTSPTYEQIAITTACFLREQGINTELYLKDNTSLVKQLTYAHKKQIANVIIIGEKEATAGQVTVRNMLSGEQQTVKPADITSFLATAKEALTCSLKNTATD